MMQLYLVRQFNSQHERRQYVNVIARESNKRDCEQDEIYSQLS